MLNIQFLVIYFPVINGVIRGAVVQLGVPVVGGSGGYLPASRADLKILG